MSKKKRNTKSLTTDDINSNYNLEAHYGLTDLYYGRNNQMLVAHQINSYNQLIKEIIPEIVERQDHYISEKIAESKIVRYRLKYENLGFKSPSLDNDEGLMFPLDAIQKNLSYLATCTATVSQWQDIVDIETGDVSSNLVGPPVDDVPYAKIPVMPGSILCNTKIKPDLSRKHCKYDAGGYFIINGNEKVVSTVEEVVLRRPLVFTKKEQNILTYYVQVRSRSYKQYVGNTQIFTIKMKKDNSITLAIPYFKEMSIFVLMRALGLETDIDIVNSIVNVEKDHNLLNRLSIAMNMQNNIMLSREEAMEYLMNNLKYSKGGQNESNPEIKAIQKKNHLIKVLSEFILPHVFAPSDKGTPNGTSIGTTRNVELDMLYKAYYIGEMINKLLKCVIKDNKEVEEHRGCDDRDSMVNKRLDPPGILLGHLFDQYFKKTISDYAKIFRSKHKVDEGKPPNIISHIKTNTIEQGLRQALSTGTFGGRKGIAQMLSRLNHLISLSFMRRVLTPTIDATNKLTSPRHLHSTQYGRLCPLETPEGHKVGIIKNLALSAEITLTLVDQEDTINKFLLKKYFRLEEITSAERYRYFKIEFNGNTVGYTNDVIKIHEGLRKLRFNGEIDKSVGLVINFKEKKYEIDTAGGRVKRPLITVDRDNNLNFNEEMLRGITHWDEFLVKHPNVIESLDVEEELNAMVATFPQHIEKAKKIMNKPPIQSTSEINRINKTNRYDDNIFVRYSHCEIHPALIMGVVSSDMSFPNHSPGTRGHYHFNQAKQAMGISRSDFRERFDITYVLYHSQIPIVASRTKKYTGANIFPAGENIVVAILSYMGYNQEDSLIMNKSAIDRGLFRAQSMSKSGETVKKNPASGQSEIFMKPNRDKVDGIKDANYNKLNEEGFIDVETVIYDNDVIIGMVIPKAISPDNVDEKPYKDNSKIFKSLIPATIDKITQGVNNDNYPILKIRMRSERIPIHGDKFASKNAQKGTMGFGAHCADMPFTESGIIPDAILNPNAIGRRATMGQLIESFWGKLCALKGIYGDATPFMGVDLHKINDELVARGFGAWGKEVMYAGTTGERMDSEIFIGPVYYQRLKQMVADKAQSRARGPKQILNRQPTEGKARSGGLRNGEMERDALIAHGSMQILKESMVDKSDVYVAYVCDICGLFAAKKKDNNYYICRSCNNSTRISKIVIPYPFMLLLNELRTMQCIGRIRTPKSIVGPNKI